MADASTPDEDSDGAKDVSGSAEDVSPPAEGRPTAKKRKSFPLKSVVIGLVTFVGLVGTTVAAVYTAVYTVSPELKPREKLGATIDHLAVEHAVDYIGYLRRMGDADPNRPEAVSPMPGDMVFVRVSLLGYKDRSYGVQVQLLDERGVQLPPREGTPTGQTLGTCEDLSPKADEDGITWRCWAVTPAAGTKYRIRAELFDYGLSADLAEGTVTGRKPLLDFKETDLFTAVDS